MSCRRGSGLLRRKQLAIFFAIVVAGIFFWFYVTGNIPFSRQHIPLQLGKFSVSFYKNATLSQKTLPITIASEAGGVYFVSNDVKEEFSIVTITGEPIKAKATLRTRYDDNPPVYASLTENARVWVEPHTRLELLIYSDAPFEYRMDFLELQTCSECMTENEFKQFLLKEILGLESALAANDTLTAARLLLHWSARVSDCSSGRPKTPGLLSTIFILPAQQIYQDIWQADAEGGSCGAFAVFYDKVLKLFGINSFTVDMGFDGALDLSFTHVITVVAEHDGVKWKFYIFDPTVDGTFVDKDGNFADIEYILSNFNKDTYRIKGASLDAEECIPRDLVRHGEESIITRKDYVYCVKELYSALERVSQERGSKYTDRFSAYQVDPQSSLHLDMLQSKIYGIGQAMNPDARQAFIDLIEKYGAETPK